MQDEDSLEPWKDRGNPIRCLLHEKEGSESMTVEEDILDASRSYAFDSSDHPLVDKADLFRDSKEVLSAPVPSSYFMDRMGPWFSLSSLPQPSQTTQSHTNPHEHHLRWPPPQP